jgi:hypothetical protein
MEWWKEVVSNMKQSLNRVTANITDHYRNVIRTTNDLVVGHNYMVRSSFHHEFELGIYCYVGPSGDYDSDDNYHDINSVVYAFKSINDNSEFIYLFNEDIQNGDVYEVN